MIKGLMGFEMFEKGATGLSDQLDVLTTLSKCNALETCMKLLWALKAALAYNR